MDRCDGLCRLASVAEEVSQSQERSHSERFDGRYLPLNHTYIYIYITFMFCVRWLYFVFTRRVVGETQTYQTDRRHWYFYQGQSQSGAWWVLVFTMLYYNDIIAYDTYSKILALQSLLTRAAEMKPTA